MTYFTRFSIPFSGAHVARAHEFWSSNALRANVVGDDLLRPPNTSARISYFGSSTIDCHLLSDGLCEERAFGRVIMGFQLELFVEPIEESLKCDLCNAVYRDPCITSCGHVFCESCLREWLTNRTSCPSGCKQISIENDTTRLLPLQILVERLRTRCANFSHGCEVVTTVAEMLAHLEVCDYTKKEGLSTLTGAGCAIERVTLPEVNNSSQAFVCSQGCGLPLLFQDASEHDCVKSLQAQVCSLQSKLTRSEHEREKVSARLVKREECMQERFTQLEKELRSYPRAGVELRTQIARSTLPDRLLTKTTWQP